MSEQSTSNLRTRLRAIPAFPPDLPILDPATVPEDPAGLFLQWLEAAIESGARQSNAFTLITARADGTPVGRTLILKDIVDTDTAAEGSLGIETAAGTAAVGYEFSTHASSRKGLELAAEPRASLVFFWRESGRQVRITGTVLLAPDEVSQADWRGRPSYTGRPNPDWQVYRLVPAEFEFMQAREDRNHTRIEYTRAGATWTHHLVETPAG
ncbi:pyridoxamine 5'-phosphate oxidase family protein [Brevibacterium sp. 50QC2O2]|uniref:pyridoxine/pyridoxamine 5'-phosphate oxidase n=1 Tax=Brevibacterium TaxID=1696 RepID=UPI00211C4BDD|nr:MULTISPECIES: pyridoxamine 5'-phosphate oxidase family protein [unclassified Brevibacterium]MCQ9369457.1 pyridoxamine 5'-phosphate oxidase family protein [Brevibacterium sp. 91QC2O2]MCQ9386864.1 pyridoxamine 5'-phosphate oxidase family protein [Brevibacterium sp. 68QC2CO]MCQ9389845.1 pyridoxamine 5'-phosphate oxidase family protein [Brevibacterium sp. 50QC2O2]